MKARTLASVIQDSERILDNSREARDLIGDFWSKIRLPGEFEGYFTESNNYIRVRLKWQNCQKTIKFDSQEFSEYGSEFKSFVLREFLTDHINYVLESRLKGIIKSHGRSPWVDIVEYVVEKAACRHEYKMLCDLIWDQYKLIRDHDKREEKHKAFQLKQTKRLLRKLIKKALSLGFTKDNMILLIDNVSIEEVMDD